MARMHSSLIAVFEQYGDDAEAGLQALANTDHALWSAYTDSAAEAKYRSDFASWVRRQTVRMSKDDIAASNGQARLFTPPRSKLVEARMMVRLDGKIYRVADLAGHEGAAILRRVAERDLKPSRTTVARCKVQLKLADHITAETDRLGRDVSVNEVVKMEAVA